MKRERASSLSLLRDLVSKAGGVTIIVVVATLFLAGAVAGVSMIGRLGGAGWIIYAVVISCYALVFGPLFVSGVTLHQRGSRRSREATQRRIEQQRRKFGIRAGRKDPPRG
jgi:hypothetical protein